MDHGQNEEKKTKRMIGFAKMDPEKRRELARKGGKTAHERGTAHSFTSETAKNASAISHERGTSRHWTPEEAREASRRSVEAKRAKREATREVSS